MKIILFTNIAIAVSVVCFVNENLSAQEIACPIPCQVEEQALGELEFLAVDIARRSVLAHYPKAGRHPIRTLEVKVRPEGDIIHTYAKLEWSKTICRKTFMYNAEVSSSIVYTPENRRVFDLTYKDNTLIPGRIWNRRIDLVSKINDEFDRLDPLRSPAPLIGNRMDILAPRQRSWVDHSLRDDHAWHVYAADEYLAPEWLHLQSSAPTQ